MAHPEGAHQGPAREEALAQGRAAGLPAALPARTPSCNAGAEALLKHYIMGFDMLGHSQYTTGPHDVASLHNISNCGHSMLSGFRITTRMCVLHCRILKQTAIGCWRRGSSRVCGQRRSSQW